MIDSRVLSVFFRKTTADEGLQYNPVASVGQPANPVSKQVHEQALREGVENLRAKVKSLISLAEHGNDRKGVDIQPEAKALSKRALPKGGFLSLLGETHPHFDALLDIAAEIPWEALEEPCLVCPNEHRRNAPDEIRPGDRFFCDHYMKQGLADEAIKCQGEMTLATRRLVEDYHLTHCVYKGIKAASGGNRFLLVVDPEENLLDSTADTARICVRHVETLHRLLKEQGFEVDVKMGKNATRNCVRESIADGSIAGVYYFGHGDFSTERGEGWLRLADGDFTATEIEEVESKVRFVFLNACSAGRAGGQSDSLQRRARSVAQAFAKGQGKIVIAPTFPILNTHAAEAAVHFFETAAGESMGEALRAVRKQSWKAYQEKDQPNICWLAYRYFGDPNAALRMVKERPRDTAVPDCRVFDADRHVNLDAFSFAAAEVLHSAAERRNQQKRTRLTPMDFLAGLIKKGDLCRFVFRQEGVDEPDTLCSALAERSEIEPKALRQELPGPWAVDRREFFRDELAALLKKADKKAADRQISEQDLLEVMADGGRWAVENDFALPSAAGVLRRLRDRERSGVDDNGAVSLGGLDAAARNIIEVAHALAQQRGMPDIPNRLMMAALVSDEKAFGSRVCRCAGVNPEMLCFIMIALAKEDSDGTARPFGLSPEACRKIVTPVLEEARKMAAGRVVNERDIFRAFCAVAHPAFKEMVRKLSDDGLLEGVALGKVDLDDLGLIEPEFWEKEMEGLDDDAKNIVRAAHSLSEDCGAFPIPNRLLLAAFLRQADGLLPGLMRRRRISADTLQAQLIAASDSGSPRKFAFDEQACLRAVRPALAKARQLAEGQPVTEAHLFRGFCAVAPTELKQALRAPVFQVDLDTLGLEALHPLAPDEGTSESAGPARPAGGAPADWDPHPFRAEQFDETAWRALGEAAGLASQQGWGEVRSPHLLAALFGSSGGTISRMMKSVPANAGDLEKLALSMLPAPPARSGGPVRLGAHTGQFISYALQMAGQQGHTKATADDLFVALCAESEGPVARLVRELGGGIAISGPGGITGAMPARHSSALAAFGVDLTERARQGLLPEIVGRDEEVNTALQTLLLSENANPLLVGEAGVGKTAIVEGIARRIALGPCPKKFQSVRLIELSAGSLVANTRLRGEFEQRIQEVLAEAREGVILFIDEIHTIVGAGSAEGSGPDAGNMLKTALARGEIRLIGATTNSEFKRTIARDKALSRRFQAQIIGPPSREATLLVLSARQPALEKHHEVSITEEAKVAAVELSGRYIVDKQWPAKARDVLERACVLAVTEGEAPADGSPMSITAEHVAKVVSRWTGVPLERLSASDWEMLTTLEQRLARRIVGQQEAIHTVSDAIRRGRQGVAGRNRPWGVYLFVGPPGVGKTELAKVIGEEVFGGAEGLIRFDMSDFSEPHSAARLIGAPPGYVGYQQGAPLVERLRTHPYSLLLFDEIEHANENVLAVLLRLLSEGTLMDQDGNLADGRNSIVVFTSNLLAPGEENRKLGFADGPAHNGQADLRALLERKLPRKLIDRLDGIVRFHVLSQDDLQELVRREVEDRKAQLAAVRAIEVEVGTEVVSWLAARVSESGQGARAVRRAVERLDTALADRLSETLQGDRRCLVVTVRGDGAALEARWGIKSVAGAPDPAAAPSTI